MAFEISPTGPMFGCRMKRPEGMVRELEDGDTGACGGGAVSFRPAGWSAHGR